MEYFNPFAEVPNDEIEKRSNITLQICDFSQKLVTYNAKTNDLMGKEFHGLFFRFSIYNTDSSGLIIQDSEIFDNGSDFQSKGYVTFDISADFKLKDEFRHYDFCQLDCIVSVIDNDGNKRLTRSFSEELEDEMTISKNAYMLHQKHIYISRETLLNDPTELLPNDILTLDVDIFFVLEPFLEGIKNQYVDNLIASSYEKALRTGLPLKRNLFPNSEVAKTLCEVSTVFRDMFAYTAEDDSEVLKIPKEDASILCTIFKIVKGVKHQFFFPELYEFLRVSDFYGISNMPEICRQYINGFLSSKKLPPDLPNIHFLFDTLMRYAKDCRDTIVLEATEAFIKNNSPSLDLDEEPYYAWLRHLELDSLLQWTYGQSLGFKLTVIKRESKADPDYSYFN